MNPTDARPPIPRYMRPTAAQLDHRIDRLKALLARGCWLPDARDLAEWMLAHAQHQRSRAPEALRG